MIGFTSQELSFIDRKDGMNETYLRTLTKYCPHGEAVKVETGVNSGWGEVMAVTVINTGIASDYELVNIYLNTVRPAQFVLSLNSSLSPSS